MDSQLSAGDWLVFNVDFGDHGQAGDAEFDAGEAVMTTVTLNPTGDTHMRSNSPTNNYSGGVSIPAGELASSSSYVRRSLVKFDLSGIPSTATVLSVTLRLFDYAADASNASTLRVFRQLRAWVDTQATWNIYKTGSSWQTAGGFGVLDCEQTDIGSIALSAVAASNYIEIALTPSAVQEIIAGTWTDNGFLLKMDTELNDSHSFYSLDNGSDMPELVVDYSLGGRQFQAIWIE